MKASGSYGLLARFGDTASLLEAVTALRREGYARFEVYSPFPVDGLNEVLETSTRNSIARLVLTGALIGGIGTLFLQWYSATIAYPINVGGRPDASWPAFIPASLEMVFLFAALFGMAGLLFHAKLPQLYHPTFNIEQFATASSDGFFVLVRADDPKLGNDPRALWGLLEQFAPLSIDDLFQ